MSEDKIVPFQRDGRYTDIRVAIRDMLAKVPDAKSGIIILFEGENMHSLHVGRAKDIAYAGAFLLKDAVRDDE
jgi:hypothetical protein